LHLQQFAEAAERAIEHLPPRCREVYLLYRQHQLSYAEIAQVLEISVKTVENHLARAMQALRRGLAAWLS
jgi:RNA polymerase sigma-70 factor (ECF subfamily)